MLMIMYRYIHTTHPQFHWEPNCTLSSAIESEDTFSLNQNQSLASVHTFEHIFCINFEKQPQNTVLQTGKESLVTIVKSPNDMTHNSRAFQCTSTDFWSSWERLIPKRCACLFHRNESGISLGRLTIMCTLSSGWFLSPTQSVGHSWLLKL